MRGGFSRRSARLIPHYQKTLGAVMISKDRMAIYEKDAKVLLNNYFPETEV